MSKRQIVPGANFQADADRLARLPLFEFRNSIDNLVTYCHVLKCAVGSNEKKGLFCRIVNLKVNLAHRSSFPETVGGVPNVTACEYAILLE
jgi:hypothetical protein